MFLRTPCGHQQCCARCLSQLQNLSCPLCRAPLPEELNDFDVLFPTPEEINAEITEYARPNQLETLNFFACYLGNVNVVDFLVRENLVQEDIDDFVVACKRGFANIIDIYLEHSENARALVNSVDDEGKFSLTQN